MRQTTSRFAGVDWARAAETLYLFDERRLEGFTMDFEQLRIFMVLAEERTFLGAARRLETSRSRVRRKLDQLEADAGTALVTRESSGLVLTAAGRALVLRGRTLLEEAEQLITHVRDVGEVPTGQLTIALPYAPASPGWETACRLTQERFPQLALALHYVADPVSLLPSQAEIALSFDEDEVEGLRFVELGGFRLRLVASERYALDHGLPGELDDLKHHRLAVWEMPKRPSDQLPLRSGRQLAIHPLLVSNDPAVVLRAVREGRAIGYLPDLPALDDPSLKPVFASDIAGRGRQRLVIPEIFADLPRVARFLEICLSTATVQDH